VCCVQAAHWQEGTSGPVSFVNPESIRLIQEDDCGESLLDVAAPAAAAVPLIRPKGSKRDSENTDDDEDES